ncbi:ryncolin-4-like [Watersipora subatra]|uniref:ryncolin-4-like n=1 Tax=Watersipora subatra TaxID=2589382 RepID=UPI00355BF017
MWLLSLLIAITCVSGALIGYDSPKQELFILNQKIKILYNLIESQCSTIVVRRSAAQDLTDPVEVVIARTLHQKLLQKYHECTQKEKIQAGTQVRDCQEYYEKGETKSGVYNIRPGNNASQEFSVWCDFDSAHGWTVFQRRSNATVSFDRPWDVYKNGFGNVDGEHWLGNDKIYHLTQTNQILNIQLKAEDNVPAFGTWQEFYIADEKDQYKLTANTTGYNGTLIDYLSYHDGIPFTTSDRDNDQLVKNCAINHEGGWWYKGCGPVHPSKNGMYWGGYSIDAIASLMRVTRN